MSKRMSRIIPAALCGVLGVTSTGAYAAEPTTSELMAQIDQLRAKVEQLEAKPVNQKDVDTTVAQVVADAEKRSQLLQSEGFTAGYTKGAFVIQSADGKFKLQPFFQYQVRHNTTWRQDGKSNSPGGASDDDTQNGWELRRMKFGFKGNAYAPELTYNFLWATGRRDGTPSLEEAFITYQFAPEYAFRIGQFKDPLYKESLTSSTRLLAVDRSILADQVFGGDNYVQGVSLIYGDKGPVRATVAYTDGFASVNTNFQDPNTPGVTTPANGTNFGFAGRAEYLLFGDWKSAEDFTSYKVSSNTLVLGVAADATQSGDASAYRHTADATYKTTGGLSLFGSYGGNFGENVSSTVNTAYTWGFVVQAAYLIPDTKWEPFARYAFVNFDNALISPAVSNETSEITLGVNYYFAGQAAKFTFDVGYLPNGSTTNTDGSGILINSDNEFYVRGQFQLLL